jgi:hypothetical protein
MRSDDDDAILMPGDLANKVHLLECCSLNTDYKAMHKKVRHNESGRLSESRSLPRRAATAPLVGVASSSFCRRSPWYYFLVQIIFGTPVGTSPASDTVVAVLWLVFGIGLPLFGFSVKLISTVGGDSIVVRFVPLVTRRIPLHNVVAYQMRRYRALAEYG